ncbi:hypothetical protein GCM10010343_47580 [Streptomyces avidinii]|nr:hypothetical protein GCM10010343_47580 [Streptomyces avidinii]
MTVSAMVRLLRGGRVRVVRVRVRVRDRAVWRGVSFRRYDWGGGGNSSAPGKILREVEAEAGQAGSVTFGGVGGRGPL